ncbi:hypothetical protein [Neorhizobium sp. T6_25]|uniref:hypothetical protein n=1 Tax=Neorhizobium sp. T6_25 TaxID=2093833 RepID=UPI001FE21884|nr:hypothetical protein [Neorhizobium sp. T6_25]
MTEGQSRLCPPAGHGEPADWEIRTAGVRHAHPASPREELDRVWANYDQRFQDQQRQIDEVKTAQGSVYGQRDIILDLRERLDRVERQRIASPGT